MKTTLPFALTNLAGHWTGDNSLWLPDEPVRQSDASAAFYPTAGGNFLTMVYTWADGDAPQDGLLLIGRGREAGTAKATWVDSWHMGPAAMALAGAFGDDGSADVLGSYAAPPDPDWGWRISIEPGEGGAFRMRMWNISPDGEEYPAVEANFTRAAG